MPAQKSISKPKASVGRLEVRSFGFLSAACRTSCSIALSNVAHAVVRSKSASVSIGSQVGRVLGFKRAMFRRMLV